MKLTVNFTSQGRLLEGTMFLPDDETKPACVACLFEGSVTGATSQITEYIAREVAAQGFACLVLDHSYYGEDEQAAQPWESPAKRLGDIKAALRFLEQQSMVDKERIVGVGISVGAEFLAQAAQETGVLKGLVMVEGPFDDSQNLIGHLDIPSIVVDETHLDSAVDETVLWIRTLFDGNRPQAQVMDSRPDWSVSDK